MTHYFKDLICFQHNLHSHKCFDVDVHQCWWSRYLFGQISAPGNQLFKGSWHYWLLIAYVVVLMSSTWYVNAINGHRYHTRYSFIYLSIHLSIYLSVFPTDFWSLLAFHICHLWRISHYNIHLSYMYVCIYVCGYLSS